jgi:hypothetical protein
MKRNHRDYSEIAISDGNLAFLKMVTYPIEWPISSTNRSKSPAKMSKRKGVLILVWISLDSIIHVKGYYVIIIILGTIKFLPTYVPQAFNK